MLKIIILWWKLFIICWLINVKLHWGVGIVGIDMPNYVHMPF